MERSSVKRHEKRLNDVLLPAVLLRELTVVLAALLFLPLLALAQGTQPQLQITSPSDGTLIAPGQTITIVATLSQGTSFAVGVVIVGEDPLGTSGLLTNAPYQFSLTIPNNSRPGGYQIVALGCTTPGVIVASSPVTIDVERPGAPVQLLAEPSQIQFESQGQQVPVRVTAKFSDGTMADVTRSSNITFSSSNATVATVSPTGLVSGVSAGSASIT